jgi:DNA-binding transcriptional LysR family regulator
MGLEDIGTFVEAAEAGSLTGAARTLGVPKSTVSRRIARLEEELGLELIRRSSRTFHLTEAGEALFRRSAPALRDIAEAKHLLQDAGTEPAGDLRVTAPIDIGSAPPFVHFCVAFHVAYPKVRLSVDLTDRFVDIVAEGFDLAFRLHVQPLEDRTSLKVRHLGPLTIGLYASPAYLARAGRPLDPGALVEHDVVGVQRMGTDERFPLRRIGDTEVTPFAVRASLLTNSMTFVPSAVEAGAGIGLVPDMIARGLVANGTLVRVLDDWEVPPATLSLLWPVSRLLSPRLRAFLDFVASESPLPGCGATHGSKEGSPTPSGS